MILHSVVIESADKPRVSWEMGDTIQQLDDALSIADECTRLSIHAAPDKEPETPRRYVWRKGESGEQLQFAINHLREYVAKKKLESAKPIDV